MSPPAPAPAEAKPVERKWYERVEISGLLFGDAYWVVTHHGPDIDAQWPGGFYCPCHGSKFDLAGRVFKNVPAPTNLTVPPHRFPSETTLLVGADTNA